MHTIRRYQDGGKSQDAPRQVLSRYLDERSMDQLLDALEFPMDMPASNENYSTDRRKYLMDLIEFSSRKTGTPKVDIIKRFNELMKTGTESYTDFYRALGLSVEDLPTPLNEVEEVKGGYGRLFKVPIHRKQFNTIPWNKEATEEDLIDGTLFGYPLIPEEQYMQSIMPKLMSQQSAELQESGPSIADVLLRGRRQPKLIYKSSNKTRTGQEPDYYVYYDSKGRPKRRPVEPEEYDRYMEENRIRKPQVIKASF